MRELLKREWLYILIILGLIVLSVMQISMFRYGFFTAYDEAYFLLKLQEAYDMSCITGKSQWNLIAVHWFPYLDLTSKVNSYLASSILVWISVLTVTGVCCTIFNKHRFLKYLAITWLLMIGLDGGLNYVTMQTAVLIWALCAFVLFYYVKLVWKKVLFAFLCGLFLGLSIFIIIPSALAVLACIALLIIILYHQDRKHMLMYLSSGMGGVFFAMLYIHLCVCDFGRILDEMIFTASYIGKSGYGYDGLSFMIQYARFIRGCLFAVLAFVGAYYLSIKIRIKYLGTLLYVLLILIYSHFQVKLGVTPSIMMLSVPLLPLLFSQQKHFSWQIFKQSETWMYLLLLVFPLLASLGTNTTLGVRIHCFLSAWLFIWFEREYKYPNEDFKRVGLAVIVLFALPLTNVWKSYQQRDDSYHFTRGNKYFSEIALMECQKDYFDKVYDIMLEYNFKPKQSVVFTALFDYCSLYAFDAVNSSNFHQLYNFQYFDKSKMLEPDFIFLCKWDSIILEKELREMPWGWPDEFDSYYIGTPEPEGASWNMNPEIESRTLYCRKSLKQ